MTAIELARRAFVIEQTDAGTYKINFTGDTSLRNEYGWNREWKTLSGVRKARERYAQRFAQSRF